MQRCILRIKNKLFNRTRPILGTLEATIMSRNYIRTIEKNYILVIKMG